LCTFKMRPRIVFLVFLFLCLLLHVPPDLQADEKKARPGRDALLSDPWLNEEAAAVLYRPLGIGKADLGPDTRAVRVLVHYGRSEFFVANGKPYGIEYEAFNEYEKFLNRHGQKKSPKITVAFIPVRLEELIPSLLEGKGDIAAGLLTVTEERKAVVAFTDPYIQQVKEVLVSYAGAERPRDLAGLSGRKIHVLRGSSFSQHLQALNRQWEKSGRQPVQIVEMPASTNADDLLEMVNAGIFQYTVVDDFVAELWSKALPDICMTPEVVLHEGGQIAWAVRPDNPELLKNLNSFIQYGRGHLKPKIQEVWRKYFKDTKLIKNPLSQEGRGLVKQVSPHFKEASAKNKFDWLMMLAQGYQESELNQGLISPRGSVGIMKLLPGTAHELGFNNIRNIGNNISAGVAYLGFIRQNYFNEPAIPPDARVDFALAAYNAGPNRIQTLRQEARKRGLNPNLWFNNVERVALDKIGEEPVRYVANINKYYLAYRMSHFLDDLKAEDLSGLDKGGKEAR
jgi:membrane-bound lytic murein transglycosylase MltF